MKNMHEARIENARKIIHDKELDALLFFSGETSNDLSSKSTYYLGGFFDSWPHAVIVTKKDAVLFTSEPDRAEKESCLDVANARKEKIHKFLNARRIRKIGIDSGFTFGKWNDLRGKLKRPVFVDITRDATKMRGVKGKEEIQKIQSACSITKQALNDVEANLALGDEGAVLRRVKRMFQNHSAESAFLPIIAGDKNSANTHYFECNRKYNDILMADIGARKEFYNADFTRTYLLKKDREMLRAKDALERLVYGLTDFIEAGKTCLQAFNYSKHFLEKEGYKKEMFTNFHSLGHGIGLEVHEYPNISPKLPHRNSKFEENMVFTLEPALYFKNKFGVRIENTYILTANGLKAL